jgi:hypothetical protein
MVSGAQVAQMSGEQALQVESAWHTWLAHTPHSDTSPGVHGAPSSHGPN